MRRGPFLLSVFALCFLLRIFWAGYVWADEGLWFTAAQEMLRGQTLYRQIWFDKPPGLALTYVALFGVAGKCGWDPLLVVRVFTIFYASSVALLVWHMGRKFWGEAEGQMAALLYAFYNATYLPSQAQPLGPDHLALLPYLLSGFFVLRERPLAAGALASLAFQINPKSTALLLFVMVYELAGLGGRGSPPLRRLRSSVLFVAGFAAGSIPWAVYLFTGSRWPAYVQDFWRWSVSYVSVYPPSEWLLRGARRTLNYAGFHAPLFIGAGLVLKYSRPTSTVGSSATGIRHSAPSTQHSALFLWLGVSFLGVAAGGRFFPRYYYQILPLLCLLAARGYLLHHRAGQNQRWSAGRLPASALRWFGCGPALWRYLMLAGLLLSFVRFHARTVVLAYQAASGVETAYMARWDDTAMDRDSRRIARHIARDGASHTLFVWGYRPEIYFYCGCRPASRFLSSQPLTGVPADIHLRESGATAPVLAAVNRAVLATQLRFRPPEFIVDGLGPYNPDLAMERYPELRDVLDLLYDREPEMIGHSVVYRRSAR